MGLAGVLVWLAATVLTGTVVPSLGAGVGSAIVVAIAALASMDGLGSGTVSAGRRSVLGSLAGTLGVGVLGYTLGSRSAETTDSVAASTGATNASAGTNASGGGAAGDSGPSADQLLSTAEAKSFGISGLEGLVSGEDFYEVDTANINPDVNAGDWSLSVTGAIGSERTIDYEQLTSMDSELRFMTLRCVSDGLNGNKMDNALWQGVPMSRVLDGVDLQGKFVMARSVDGYYEEFPVEALKSGFVAYGKDGDVLPRQHGYPARADSGPLGRNQRQMDRRTRNLRAPGQGVLGETRLEGDRTREHGRQTPRDQQAKRRNHRRRPRQCGHSRHPKS